MKYLLIILILYMSLQARENQWVKSVVELIPYGWELNKTSCKKMKRKVSYKEEQDTDYLYGNKSDFYAWCGKEGKKFNQIRFYNNEYFKRLNLDKTKGSLFLEASKYYNNKEDDFKIDYYDSGEVYSHDIYYNDNILIIITSDKITIKFDDSDF